MSTVFCMRRWLEGWLGQWMQRTCAVNTPLKNYLDCEEMLDTLRTLKCRDKGDQTLMEAFADLDCGWDSGAISIISRSSYHIWSLMSISILFSFSISSFMFRA